MAQEDGTAQGVTITIDDSYKEEETEE